MMSTVAVELDENLVAILSEMDQPVDCTVRKLIVLELYRLRRISSGKAAELLDMPRFDFVAYASDLGIPFFTMTDEQWEAEQQTIGRLTTSAT